MEAIVSFSVEEVFFCRRKCLIFPMRSEQWFQVVRSCSLPTVIFFLPYLCVIYVGFGHSEIQPKTL